MSPTFAEKIRTTSEAFVLSFDGEWLLDATKTLRAPSCQHTILPTSLGIPVQSNDQWFAYLKRTAPLIKQAKMTINSYVGIPEQCQSVCRSSVTAETPVGPFKNEYVWFFTFDETGEKIVEVTEMVDSHAAVELWGKLEKAGLREQH